MMKLKYRGIPYLVLGRFSGWESGTCKVELDRRFGGWENCDKWWSFSWGIKTKLFNTEKPYRQYIIDSILNNNELVLNFEHFRDSSGLEMDGGMWMVRNLKGQYIGNILDGYYASNLTMITPCTGYDVKNKTWYGWSHRAKCGFTYGDRIFDEKYGDEDTLFTEHGAIVIDSIKDMEEAALNFAEHVS